MTQIGHNKNADRIYLLILGPRMHTNILARQIGLLLFSRTIAAIETVAHSALLLIITSGQQTKAIAVILSHSVNVHE